MCTKALQRECCAGGVKPTCVIVVVEEWGGACVSFVGKVGHNKPSPGRYAYSYRCPELGQRGFGDGQTSQESPSTCLWDLSLSLVSKTEGQTSNKTRKARHGKSRLLQQDADVEGYDTTKNKNK